MSNLPCVSDDGWPEAVVRYVAAEGKKENAEYRARHGQSLGLAPYNGVLGGLMLKAIHVLAKRVDEIHKAAAADAKALNQTVETFAKALEEIQENGFRYRGYWRQGTHATRGEAYTENGGLWYCVRATTDRPRNESPDWNMCARAGRDGRDAR